jgi:hypothetical protein
MTAKIRNSDNTKTLNMKVFSEKYGVFIDGLALSGFAGKYWFILVLTRWSVVSIILVSLRDFSTI